MNAGPRGLEGSTVSTKCHGRGQYKHCVICAAERQLAEEAFVVHNSPSGVVCVDMIASFGVMMREADQMNDEQIELLKKFRMGKCN